MSTLAQCIERLIKKHGSLRALSRAANIDAGYISRLRSGEKTDPGLRILAALGIEQTVTYKRSRRTTLPMPSMTRENAAAYHELED